MNNYFLVDHGKWIFTIFRRTINRLKIKYEKYYPLLKIFLITGITAFSQAVSRNPLYFFLLKMNKLCAWNSCKCS